jgi:hypothetical protein
VTALDAILDGFESALELERELGNRLIPCDRKLLDPIPSFSVAENVVSSANRGRLPIVARVSAGGDDNRNRPQSPRPLRPEAPTLVPILFVHHRPFTERAQALMDNIIKAMKLGEGQYQVVFGGGPLPPAKVCVVLGSNALGQIMPGGACQPGSWTKTPSGADALVTYSPEFILRFSDGSKEQKECKRKMWDSLKSALSRAGLPLP